MQGYFSYTFKGSKKELEEIRNKMKEISKTDEDIKFLLQFESDIENYYGNKGKYELTYGLSESCNVNGVPFVFDEMMTHLANLFDEAYIEGTGYYLDCEAYPSWKKEKGTKNYEETFRPVDIFLSLDEYDEDLDVFNTWIECLGMDWEIPGEIMRDDNGKWIMEEVLLEIEDFGITLSILLEDIEEDFD